MIRHMKMVCAYIVQFLWGLFLNGFLTLLPITLTIAIFNLTFKVVKTWLEPLAPYRPDFLAWVPHAEIVLVIGFIFVFGAVLRFFILKQVIQIFEKVLFQLPLIRPVYTGIKQLVGAFNPTNMMSFKKIVLIQFPRTGLYSVGFLTSQLAKEIAPNTNGTYYNVFIPTTPNPTSGYFVVVAEHEMVVTDLTRQEAMAMIISGGIIQPERFGK